VVDRHPAAEHEVRGDPRVRRDRLDRVPLLGVRGPLLQRLAEHTSLKPLSIGNDALAVLMRYGWPGNVRQLAGVLFRAGLQCDSSSLTAEHFPHIAIQSRFSGRRSDFSPILSKSHSDEAIAVIAQTYIEPRVDHALISKPRVAWQDPSVAFANLRWPSNRMSYAFNGERCLGSVYL